jgi:hypothetical protein
MKFFLTILICFSVVACLSSEDKKIKEGDNLIAKDPPFPINQRSEFTDTFGVALVDTIPVEVKIKIGAFSLDSIIANVTLKNKWHSTIWLYSPLLRDSFMAANAFTIIDKKHINIPFIGSDPKRRFRSRIPDSSYVLAVHDIRPDNLLGFKCNDSIQLTCNLAKVHDFRYLKMRGEEYFRLEFSYEFPVIENGRHVYKDNYNLNVVQPLYFQVSTISDITKAWKEKYNLPR